MQEANQTLSVAALLKLRKQAAIQLEEAQRFHRFVENQLAHALKAAAIQAGQPVDFEVSAAPPEPPRIAVKYAPIRPDEARGRLGLKLSRWMH